MKTLLALLTTVSFIAMGTASYAADVGTPSSKTTYEAKDNGGYKVKAKSEVTTPAGTDKAGANMVDVSVDDDGSVQKTIETKAKTDAKGLMNEKEKLNKTITTQKANGGYKVKSIKENVNAAGTNLKTEAKTNVSVDANGNTKTETETTKIVDPKGLMNKTESTVKTINGQIVK